MSVSRVNSSRRLLSRWFSLSKLKKEDETAKIAKLTRAAIVELTPYLPLEDQVNRYAEKAQRKSMHWVKHYKIVTDEILLQKVASSNFGIFMAKAHPRCSKRRLYAIALFVTWLFFYDDYVEKCTNAREMTSLHKRSLKILKGGRLKEDDHAIMKGLHQVVSRIDHINRSRLWKRQLIGEVRRYCKATFWEMNNRLAHTIPSQKEYMLQRPYTSGTLVMFLFALFAEKIRFSKEEYQQVREMSHCAAWIVNLLNDILSAENEKRRKDIHNIIFCIKNDRKNCSYEEAFEETVALLKRKLREFDNYRQIAKMNGGTLAIYANALWEWINAHDLWARESARYRSYFAA